MRRICLGTAVVALLAPSFAGAHSIPLSAVIDPEQATTSDETATGSGSATLSFVDETNMLSWNIVFSGLSGTETLAHFHGPALPGTPAGVEFGLSLGSPKVGMATLAPQQAADLLAGLWYINIHSSRFAGGEIRGQVQVIPEPSSLAMLLLGGGGLLFVRRRHRG